MIKNRILKKAFKKEYDRQEYFRKNPITKVRFPRFSKSEPRLPESLPEINSGIKEKRIS